jgi:hypothetical protein
MVYYKNGKERTLRINVENRSFLFVYSSGEEERVIREAYELARDQNFGMEMQGLFIQTYGKISALEFFNLSKNKVRSPNKFNFIFLIKNVVDWRTI